MTYETDFHGWTQEQARILRRLAVDRVNTDLDLEHLAEEIEALGRADLRAIHSELARIIEHLLKLAYSPAELPRAGWLDAVDLHRVELQQLLEDNRGLVQRIDPGRAWCAGRRLAVKSLERRDGVPPDVVPQDCPFTLAQIMDPDWYPAWTVGP
jgi:hypothetical protein